MTAIDSHAAQQFWEWFQESASRIVADVANPNTIRQIDSRLAALEPALSWELGPGTSQPWRLVISPDLNPDLRDTANALVAFAPKMSGWEFYSSRQPKDWNFKFELNGASGKDALSLDASGWRFVLLRYPNGEHEVLIEGRAKRALTADERWGAAAVVLESVLGEDVVLDHVQRFDLVEELNPSIAEKAKPIRALRDTFASVLR